MSDHEDLELELLPPLFPSSSVLFWTSERVEKLKALQARKLSGSAIAAEFGVTRNTVMGKLARLGLNCESMPPSKRGSRNPNVKRAIELKKSARPKPAPSRPWRPAPSPERTAVEPTPATACTLFDLTNETCRYPCGAPMARAELFCGSPEADFAAGVVYCSAHSAIAFCPPRQR